MQSIEVPIEVIDHSQQRMVEAVLIELQEALASLLDLDQVGVIDLKSLPVGESGVEQLRSLLGTGEIHVTLGGLGHSEIFETAFAGIWWVSHFDSEGLKLAEFVEVCWVPEIVKSQRADALQSLAEIHQKFNPEP